MYCTAACGSPTRVSAAWIASTSARLLRSVSEPPRRIVALPVFRQRVATSMVTFGRAS